MDRRKSTLKERLVLSLFGAGMGWTVWVLTERFRDQGTRADLCALTAAIVFAIAALGMAGPLPLRRAIPLGVPLALVSSALFYWASFRFDDAGAFLDSLLPTLALVILYITAVPFLIAWRLDRRHWRSYPVLYREAWSLVVRLTAAALFTGIFWLCYGLSHQLFRLVDLSLLGDLWARGWFAPTVSGAVFALALGAFSELAAGASPALAVRLLRLLIPAVTAVIAVFLLQLALRGPGDVFAGLSATAILLAFGAAAVTLVSAGVEGDNVRAVQSRPMRILVRLLAFSVLPLAAGAGFALALRVAQYGWSPTRLAAALLVLVCVGYGIGYALAVLSGRFNRWQRRVNVAMALAMALGAMAWLTPVLNAERISAASQLARFADGRTAAEAVDIVALERQWGRAGRAALAAMRTLENASGYAGLMARLDADAAAPVILSGQARAALGAAGPEAGAVIDAFGTDLTRQADAACAGTLAPELPGCALYLGDLVPDWPGNEALLFLAPPGESRSLLVRGFRRSDDGAYLQTTPPLSLGAAFHQADPAAIIGAVRGGALQTGVASFQSLRVGPLELMLRP